MRAAITRMAPTHVDVPAVPPDFVGKFSVDNLVIVHLFSAHGSARN
jgi:hypothetical protein